MNDLLDKLQLSGAAVSRNISMLGRGSPRDPGLGLLEAYEDEFYRRRKLVRLTQKGKQLAELVVADMNSVKGV